MRGKRYFLLLLISLHSIFGLSLRALEADTTEAENLFISGNVHYGEGNFEKARDAYEQALRYGHTQALHFNLANTYFQLGDTGQAVLHYLRAKVLEPTDPDTEANLRFVREAAGLVPDPPARPWLANLADGLPRNTWTFLAIAGLAYTAFVVFVLSAWRPLGVVLKLTALMTGAVSGLAFTVLTHDLATYQTGVVVAHSAELKVAPTANSPSHSTTAAGETAQIRERRAEFYNVQFSNGRTGYLHRSEFIPLHLEAPNL